MGFVCSCFISCFFTHAHTHTHTNSEACHTVCVCYLCERTVHALACIRACICVCARAHACVFVCAHTCVCGGGEGRLTTQWLAALRVKIFKAVVFEVFMAVVLSGCQCWSPKGGRREKGVAGVLLFEVSCPLCCSRPSLGPPDDLSSCSYHSNKSLYRAASLSLCVDQ